VPKEPLSVPERALFEHPAAPWLLLLTALLLVGAVAAFLVRRRLEQQARERLGRTLPDAAPQVATRLAEAPRSLLEPWTWLPPAVALVVTLAAHLLFGFGGALAAALGVVAGVLAWLADGWRLARTTARLETQLAEGVDLMVAALRAGAGITDALAAASKRVRDPFGRLLADAVERLRLGDDPLDVLAVLRARVPLESYRLLTFALASQWQGGGSLSATLAGVARGARDRLALAGRIRSQAIETQVSVLAVLLVTWGLALVLWRAEPGRMESFLASALGGWLLVSVLLLQALGIVWITRLARIRL
jgi:tight adherence protein B